MRTNLAFVSALIDIDPTIVVASITALAGAWATWRTTRKETRQSRIKAQAETSIQREELVDRRIQVLLDRMEGGIHTLEEEVRELTERVTLLERERSSMLQWMAWNKLSWPPPDDSGFYRI